MCREEEAFLNTKNLTIRETVSYSLVWVRCIGFFLARLPIHRVLVATQPRQELFQLAMTCFFAIL